jgi:hypothetical protein
MSEEHIARTQRQLDALVAAALRCEAGHPLHPVAQKGSAQAWWTCPVPGCSRMRGPTDISGTVSAILVGQGIPHSKLKETIARYKKSLTEPRS